MTYSLVIRAIDAQFDGNGRKIFNLTCTV